MVAPKVLEMARFRTKGSSGDWQCMLGHGASQIIVCGKGLYNFDKNFVYSAKLDESAMLKEN